MTNPTPKQLAMARRIAAEDASQQYPNFGADIIAGHCDDAPRVRCALAAIIETSERAARLSEQLATKGDAYERACGGWDDPNVEHPRSWSNVEGDGQRKVAATIRKGDHLDD